MIKVTPIVGIFSILGVSTLNKKTGSLLLASSSPLLPPLSLSALALSITEIPLPARHHKFAPPDIFSPSTPVVAHENLPAVALGENRHASTSLAPAADDDLLPRPTPHLLLLHCFAAVATAASKYDRRRPFLPPLPSRLVLCRLTRRFAAGKSMDFG